MKTCIVVIPVLKFSVKTYNYCNWYYKKESKFWFGFLCPIFIKAKILWNIKKFIIVVKSSSLKNYSETTIMVCFHKNYVRGYVLIMIWNHTKYIRQYEWSKVWNHTKYIQLHKILQMYDSHYRTEITCKEENVVRRKTLLWRKRFYITCPK